MDKSKLMAKTGILSAKFKVGEDEETLYFNAKTPEEITLFLGAQRRYTNDDAGDVARQKGWAKFIAASLCDETGEPLLTEAEARQIPAGRKPEICNLIVEESNTLGESVGKV